MSYLTCCRSVDTVAGISDIDFHPPTLPGVSCQWIIWHKYWFFLCHICSTSILGFRSLHSFPKWWHMRTQCTGHFYTSMAGKWEHHVLLLLEYRDYSSVPICFEPREDVAPHLMEKQKSKEKQKNKEKQEKQKSKEQQKSEKSKKAKKSKESKKAKKSKKSKKAKKSRKARKAKKQRKAREAKK